MHDICMLVQYNCMQARIVFSNHNKPCEDGQKGMIAPQLGHGPDRGVQGAGAV